MAFSYIDSRNKLRNSVLHPVSAYGRAAIKVTEIASASSDVIQFVVNPQSLNIGYSNNFQTIKTMSGWYLGRQGAGLTSVSFSGYLLDASESKEKAKFLEQYKKYCIDQQNGSSEYYNRYYVDLYIEGSVYRGAITAVNLAKSAQESRMYQYNISFMGVAEKTYSSSPVGAPLAKSITTSIVVPIGTKTATMLAGTEEDWSSKKEALGLT